MAVWAGGDYCATLVDSADRSVTLPKLKLKKQQTAPAIIKGSDVIVAVD